MDAKVQAAFAAIINRPDINELTGKLPQNLKDTVTMTLELLRQKADFAPAPIDTPKGTWIEAGLNMPHGSRA